VRGTVTTLSGYKDSFFLQDGTAGIAVNRLDEGSRLQAGDVIEVEGVSEPGWFAPSLNSRSIHIIGRSKFSQARIFRLSELTGGTQDSQWIALRGVVRAGQVKQIWGQQTLSLTVDTGEGLMNARVLDYAGDYRRLVDSEVLLRGACGTIYNGHRQFVGVRMFIPSLREIAIEKPGGGDPFSGPLRPLDGLLQFGRDTVPYHRIRVRGTVIYQSPEQEMYLEQGGLTLLLHTETTDRVPVGTVVEAAGFAAQGTYSPELQNAVFRVIGKALLDEPVSMKASQIVEIRNSALYIPYDGQLVRMRGQVVGLAETSREQTVLLNDAGTVFPVKLQKGPGASSFEFSPGSFVQVTGICSADTNKNGDPESFQILARSLADFLVLTRPSWWNTRHTLGILVLTILSTLAALWLIYRQRRRIERQRQALISSARVFQRVLGEVPLLALTLDRQGRVTACNELLLKLLGRSAGEVMGRNWREHFVAETCPALEVPLTDSSFSETLRTKQEDYILSKDGSRRLVSWFNAVIHDASGNGTATIALGEDISERKRAEEELSSAVAAAQAASQAKSEFLANMSHEIRTPMNGILGMTELVLQSELNAEQRENLNLVKHSADALLTIINDILDFSKVEVGKLTLEIIPFCLEDVLSEAIAPLAMQAASKGITMYWSADRQAPRYVVGDPGRLRQVLLNLLGNALKFTKAGEITLQVETECLTESGVELHFRVKDTGIGIPAKQQGEIFKAFSQADTSVTRQFGGTGLGLTICARLVHLFGGKIWVESEAGAGSTFHFTAKLGIGTAPATVAPAVDTSNMLLLLVDDNGISRDIFKQALANLSSQATVVENGEAALHAFEQAASSGCPYPLVILDVEMPGSNGFSVAERIRKIAGPDRTKLILLASHGLRGDAALCAQIGIGGYLHKPVTCIDLQRAISEVMGNASPRLVTRHSLREARRHILLAEGNLVNQRLAVKLLEKQGHTVVIAQNGQEAVNAVERECFDIVLMDVQMPVMGGFEATAQIRSREKDRDGRVKILALTANAMSGDREKCLEAGMDGYLAKPLKFDELYAALA
jgi:PAS domain S-box-containing protein